MASLYQRFTGTINTNKSYPNPPEASHLLGQGVEVEENAVRTPRPGQEDFQSREHCEDEDVRNTLTLSPPFSLGCLVQMQLGIALLKV